MKGSISSTLATLWTLILLLATSATVYAEDPTPVANVVRVKGAATAILNGGQNGETSRELKRRSPIYEGDIIRTTDLAALTLRFKDQSLVDLSANTVFVVQSYQFAEGEEQGSAALQLLEGSLRNITGKIGKANPDEYEVKTPSASIGIRGTHFEVTVPTVMETFAAIYEGVIEVNRLNGLPDQVLRLSSAEGVGFAAIGPGKPPLPMAVAPTAFAGPIPPSLLALPLFGDDEEPEEPAPEPEPEPAPEPVSRFQDLYDMYQANQFKQLYTTASGMVSEWEGDPEFDFLFAVGAVETGHYDQAIFALERIVMVAPDHYRAHLELGRAYFFTQDLDKSEYHFNLVLATVPPEPVRLNVQKFLAAIKKQRAQQIMQLTSLFRMGVGHDTNINSGTQESQLDDNFWGITEVSDSSKPLTDQYAQFNASFGLAKPLSKRAGFQANIHGSTRLHSTYSEYNLDTLGVSIQSQKTDEDGLFGVGTGYQYVRFAQEHLQQSLSLNIQWQHDLPKPFRLLTQYQFIYVDQFDTELLDNFSDTVSAGVAINQGNLQHRAMTSWSQATYPSLDSAHQENTGYGLNWTTQWQISPKWLQMFSATYKHTDYLAEDPVFGTFVDGEAEGVKRTNDNTQLSATTQYLWTDKVRFTWTVSNTQNTSNINVYNHDRLLLEIGTTMNF